MIITEEAYLEHYGKKGMQWGVRRAQAATVAKATGRVAWKGTKAVGRGTKKTAVWAKDNPKAAAAIAIGGYLVVRKLQGKSIPIHRVSNDPQTTRGLDFVKKFISAGNKFGKKNLSPDLNTPFKATLGNGKKVFYGKEAAIAFQKAGVQTVKASSDKGIRKQIERVAKVALGTKK
jgi:hypothetical protein